MSNVSRIVGDGLRLAEAAAGQFPAARNASMQSAILLGRMLPGLLVPALRGRWFTSSNEQNVILATPEPMSLAASTGDIARSSINIGTHMDFYWKETNILSGPDGASALTFDVRLTGGSNDRAFIQGRGTGVHAEAFRLRSGDWSPWSKAQMVARSSSIQIVLTNLADTAHTRVDFLLRGVANYDLDLLDNTGAGRR